jgi:hypothetical protein
VLVKHSFSPGPRDPRDGLIRLLQKIEDVIPAAGDEHIAPRPEEIFKALPIVADNGCSARSGFKQAARRAPPQLRH